MTRASLAAACLLAGCASGRSSIDPPDARVDNGAARPDAKVFLDGAVDLVPQPDAYVNPPPPADAAVVVADASVVADAPAVPQCHDQQLLTNPVLDLSPAGTGWVQLNIDDAAPIITGDDGIPEDSAPFKAWMGGLEGYDYGVNSLSDMLYQDVAVPANTTQIRVTAKYEVRTAETEAFAYDTAQFSITQTNGTPIQTIKDLSNLTPTTSWTAIDQVLAQNLAGQTIRLRIVSTNDVIDPTSFYFDTLAITATICQ